MLTPVTDSWPSPANFDDIEPLINAISLSTRGTTPQRWIIDMSSHEIGLNPHNHIFYINPNEGADGGDFLNISCQICFKQYDVNISSKGVCSGLSHHLHSKFEEDSVLAICCHCGSTINATMEQPTIPPSMLYRIRTARKPKAMHANTPQFHDTVDVLIKILRKAVEPGSDSINTQSNTFKNKIGLDEPCKEFFKLAKFSLIDQRFYAPDQTPENIQLLNRCRFQLELLLHQENPSLLSVTGKCIETHNIIRSLLDERHPNEPAIDLSNRATLMAELQSPLGKLGCITDMSDDIVIDAFLTHISHDMASAHQLMDVLVETQKRRKSEKLDIEIACRRSEGIVTTSELRSAYMDFDIPNFGDGISNEVLLSLLRASRESASAESLKIIAKARDDSSINRLLEEPLEEPMTGDPILDLYYAQNPVGLSNIGNTCYLNSLLQYIYTIKDIREAVMNMEAFVENEDAEGWEEKVIDGRNLSRQDVAEAKEKTMSILMYRLNAAFQPVMSERSNKPVDRFNSLFYVKAVRKTTELDNSTGKQVERLIPEDFSTLLLNVKEPVVMEELIDDYFDTSEPEPEEHSDDSSTTEISHSNPTTIDGLQHRDITVTELPPILQIHLMRTQFDRKGNTSYKSNATVAIPKRIYMDQYLESDQEANANRIKRMKIWKRDRRECRKALEVINQKRENLALDQADANAEAGSDITIPPNDSNVIRSGLDNEETVQLSKISSLTAKIGEETADLNQAEYKIHAVFHHEGGADFGHYWVYILDEASEEPRWLKYSDDFVSEVGILST
ncbi:ubiquitin-specific protease ubp2 [Entomortierella chlamydospora]|uniref:ubiquitinyl hydrolase 1 n=1 Tax=Entomortierella chlamydospora TaxID=101097 RepID=A0A9P6T1F9_9FUNG|nr:ubiquitin-specific protease ubp2 [Entomortierella chlamydospora]